MVEVKKKYSHPRSYFNHFFYRHTDCGATATRSPPTPSIFIRRETLPPPPTPPSPPPPPLRGFRPAHRGPPCVIVWSFSLSLFPPPLPPSFLAALRLPRAPKLVPPPQCSRRIAVRPNVDTLVSSLGLFRHHVFPPPSPLPFWPRFDSPVLPHSFPLLNVHAGSPNGPTLTRVCHRWVLFDISFSPPHPPGLFVTLKIPPPPKLLPP